MRYYCSSKPRFVSPDLSGFETNTSLINDANVVQTFLFEPIWNAFQIVSGRNAGTTVMVFVSGRNAGTTV